jgi:hypothetical protein
MQTTKRTAAEWSELILALGESGLGAKAFASQKGLSLSSLRWWKRELARRAQGAPQGSEAAGSGSRSVPPKGAVSLARVVRLEGHSTGLASATGVVVMAGGFRIAVERGFDGHVLRDVVDALAGAR